MPEQSGGESKDRAGSRPCVFLDSHLVSLGRNQGLQENSLNSHGGQSYTTNTVLKQCQNSAKLPCAVQRGFVRELAGQKGAAITEL